MQFDRHLLLLSNAANGNAAKVDLAAVDRALAETGKRVALLSRDSVLTEAYKMLVEFVPDELAARQAGVVRAASVFRRGAGADQRLCDVM